MTEGAVAIMTLCVWSFVIGFAIGPRRRAAKASQEHLRTRLIDILPPADPTALYIGERIVSDAKATLLAQKLTGKQWTYQKFVTVSLPQGKVKITMEVE